MCTIGGCVNDIPTYIKMHPAYIRTLHESPIPLIFEKHVYYTITYVNEMEIRFLGIIQKKIEMNANDVYRTSLSYPIVHTTV